MGASCMQCIESVSAATLLHEDIQQGLALGVQEEEMLLIHYMEQMQCIEVWVSVTSFEHEER